MDEESVKMTTQEISKTYSPTEIEDKWYEIWEENNCFAPKKNTDKGAYCIIMPPPNVTGRLHMGHALDIATQDVLTRFKRMKGFKALWLPGMDHAGIATQAVVEKLLAEKNISKFDLGREKFLEEVWKWKKEFGDIISEQQRKLGSSCDWNYFLFTMDEHSNKAVRHAFTTLYNEGLIYQADYIINWDPVLQSAISDAEVEHKEVEGKFYYLKYFLKDSDEYLTVATTRPETLLGDTAVAVNPTDDRFKHLIGKTAIVPLCGREVPIIGDEYVAIDKGTGCLKVTPGHDFNDFEIGKRHNLPIVNILNKDGTLNEKGLSFKGLKVKKARKEIVAQLKETDILIKEEKHIHQVGHGDRSKEIIEPLVSKQWFLNVKEMAKEAVEAVEKDDTVFYHKSWENTYFSWLREPRDWCLSRQLWWGHRIPVFNCGDCSHQWADTEEPIECSNCNSTNFSQDQDVLDTWFSSGLWPMTTLGWPDENLMKEKEFSDFYPTATLVTGYDIIFFWVARMMMMGMKFTGKVPFEKVYVHAIVRDKLGRKMSKSLGNGIDPLQVVNEYGADALRFTLAAGSGYNRNLNLDPERIEGYRNYINKLWNAFRFIYPFLENAKDELPNALDQADKWLLHSLNEVTDKMNSSLEEFRYDDSCHAIYAFTYEKFCGWSLEMAKSILYSEDETLKAQKSSVLKYVFKKMIKLLHPIAPYITEELWTYLKNDSDDLLINQSYPEADKSLNYEQDCMFMEKFIEAVVVIRNLRATFSLSPKFEVDIAIYCDKKELIEFINKNTKNLFNLARVKNISWITNLASEKPKKAISGATADTQVFMVLDNIPNLDAHTKKLEKEIQKLQVESGKFEKKLGNKKFTDNAPEEVIAEVKSKHDEVNKKLSALKDQLETFS